MSEKLILGNGRGPRLEVQNGKTEILIPGLKGYTSTAANANGPESLQIRTSDLKTVPSGTIGIIPHISFRGKDSDRRTTGEFGIIGIIVPADPEDEVQLICANGSGINKAWVQHPNVGNQWDDGSGRTPTQQLLDMYYDSQLTTFDSDQIPTS